MRWRTPGSCVLGPWLCYEKEARGVHKSLQLCLLDQGDYAVWLSCKDIKAVYLVCCVQCDVCSSVRVSLRCKGLRIQHPVRWDTNTHKTQTTATASSYSSNPDFTLCMTLGRCLKLVCLVCVCVCLCFKSH